MNFKVRAIIEILAKPEEAVALTLKELVKLMSERDYIHVLGEKYEKPEKVKDDFYSGFVEVTAEINEFSDLLGFIIDFGPTSLEILEPEGVVEIDSGDMEAVLNDLIAKIQEFDKKLKIITSQYAKLEREVKSGK